MQEHYTRAKVGSDGLCVTISRALLGRRENVHVLFTHWSPHLYTRLNVLDNAIIARGGAEAGVDYSSDESLSGSEDVTETEEQLRPRKTLAGEVRTF